MSAELAGRCVVLTGASSGIGLETAKGLALRGADLILVCRSAERGAAAVAEIQQAAPGHGSITLRLGDLAEQADVRRIAQEILAYVPAVHVLINNVGAVYTECALTTDGVERQHATNCVNPFLLTRLLLPALQRGSAAGEPSRVVCVCSLAHRRSRWIPGMLRGEGRYVSLLTYRHSKLCQALIAVELARRLSPQRVTVNSLCPGYVATEIGAKHARGLARGVWRFASRFFQSPSEGSRTPVFLAASPEVRGVTGQFFEKCRQTTYAPAAQSRESARELWNLCSELCGLDATLSPVELGEVR